MVIHLGRGSARFGGGRPELKLANAIAADMTDMRPSLLPGLLAAARRNANRGYADVALFEVGQVFLSDQPEGQHNYATGIRTGGAAQDLAGRRHAGCVRCQSRSERRARRAWPRYRQAADRRRSAGLVASGPRWPRPARPPRPSPGSANCIRPGPPSSTSPDRSPRSKSISTPPRAAQKADPRQGRAEAFRPDAGDRDFAFLLDRDVPADKVLRAARNADKALIADVGIFDLFEGKGVADGKKSVAIASRSSRPTRR